MDDTVVYHTILYIYIYHGTLGLWECGTMVLWCVGMGRRKVSTIVPSEFTCIIIQMGLWYPGTLQKMHSYFSFTTVSHTNVFYVSLFIYIYIVIYIYIYIYYITVVI